MQTGQPSHPIRHPMCPPPKVPVDWGRFRAVLFDLDGVITQSARIHAAAWKETFDDFLARHSKTTGTGFEPFDIHRDYTRHVDGLPRRDGIRAFLPGSHLGDDLPSSIDELRGQRIKFKILELSRRDKNLVVSHKVYIKEQEKEQRKKLFESLEKDQEIEGTIRQFGQKAKDGSLSYEDLTGGTFTISNGGVFGSMLSTPILNPPQSGILGLHNITDRPMVVDGEIKIRPMMYLALSYDHRIVDGKGAVTFLVRVKEALEDPRRLLMDL